MPAITFSSPVCPRYTPVSDTFILQYMPSANGAYVKVYLYFLHHSLRPAVSLSTKEAAQSLPGKYNGASVSGHRSFSRTSWGRCP